uniref:Uncharacterized protein n=1 Tax=Setaria viridis TaxID=4556 RepID=A0A4U6VBQ5_SETVI|nr:hypothetical protein SEVIR_3G102700v2 [Setaria viridis]
MARGRSGRNFGGGGMAYWIRRLDLPLPQCGDWWSLPASNESKTRRLNKTSFLRFCSSLLVKLLATSSKCLHGSAINRDRLHDEVCIVSALRTSTVEISDEMRGHSIQKAKIEIVLGKTENFDELMAASAGEATAGDGEEQS